MKLVNNIKKNTILLLGITLVILYILLKDDWKQIVKAFENIDIRYVILSLLFFFASISLKGYANYKITNDKEKISLKEAIKHNLIAQFFNGITPFSTGGQPMEIYMIKEHNISIAKATNQTIQSFIFYQIALVICGILAVTYNFIFHLFPKVKLLQNLVLLGFLINVGVAVVLILISNSRKMTNNLCTLAKKVSHRLKLKVTDEDLEEKFDDFYEGFQEMKKRKGLLTSGILLNIASLLCLYVTPFFILYSMSNNYSLTIPQTLASSAYVYIVGSFVPIPGASGGIEYSFTQFFGNFIGLDMISAVLIIWRFITYYLGIILGAILFNIEKKVTK